MRRLSKDLSAKLADVADDLSHAIEEARDYYEARSERWQTSNAGEAYAGWIERLEALFDALNDAPEQPED